ncbi:hypothetical protein D9757_006471 [Collybiopsis confluens]|uniref:DUF300-domain-containing protein n=1 Tax=Collybiopsis confluens TaxID=2823264 RepID=A0A8H5M874_9AGAR|nr:hypothetical protein D9757_006471 [Collybiopsis confluens]
MANITDGRCWRELKPDSPSLLQNGNLVFQAHHVGWIVTGFFTIVAIVTSAWLINNHLVYYTNKREQRYIVRILFMVPIYAIISMASYLFWNHSTPLLLIRDGYESTVLTSFFYLLLNYISHNPDEQKAIFMKNGISSEYDREALRRGEKPSKWMFPLGFVKWRPRDGLLFLQLMKWGVLQYCVIRPATTLAAVVLNYVGLYCEDSWGLGWGHPYITVIVSISVTIAMYCLIQLYLSVSKILAPQKPLLKLFSVKAIVFLTFWQATFLSVLSMFDVIKDTTYMTADDINIGIGAIAETFEMMLFGFLHLKAFTYKPYVPGDTSEKLPAYHMSRFRALGHAMDFRETFREIWIGTVYLWEKLRGRDPGHDVGARRVADYESAFGVPRRSENAQKERSNEMGDPLVFPMISTEKFPYDSPPGNQWLGDGHHYGYGVFREKSDDFETQIEKELERRGYGSHIPGRGHIKPSRNEESSGFIHQPQRSWWQSIYNRVSQSSPEEENGDTDPVPLRHASRRKHPSRDAPGVLPDIMDEPPPPSLFRSKRPSRHAKAVYSPVDRYGDEETAAPLSTFTGHQISYLPRQPQQWDSPPQRYALPPATAVSPPTSPLNHFLGMSSSPPLLPSSPPPQSLLLPMMIPHGDTSADSLLGRVFPSKSSDADLTAHGTDNTHSTGYVHQHPRTAVLSFESGYNIGVAGQRNPNHTSASVLPKRAMSATVFDHTPDHWARPRVSREYDMDKDNGYHSAARPASIPIPEPSWGAYAYSSPVPFLYVYSPHGGSVSPPQRQSPAQSGVRSSPPRRPNRRSMPVVLTIPEPLAKAPGIHDSIAQSNDLHHPLHDPSSTLAQPSSSGQLGTTKFPSPGIFSEDDHSLASLSQFSRSLGIPDRHGNQNSRRQADVITPSARTRNV